MNFDWAIIGWPDGRLWITNRLLTVISSDIYSEYKPANQTKECFINPIILSLFGTIMSNEETASAVSSMQKQLSEKEGCWSDDAVLLRFVGAKRPIMVVKRRERRPGQGELGVRMYGRFCRRSMRVVEKKRAKSLRFHAYFFPRSFSTQQHGYGIQLPFGIVTTRKRRSMIFSRNAQAACSAPSALLSCQSFQGILDCNHSKWQPSGRKPW